MEHRIHQAPDFAHELAVHIRGHDFSDDQLRRGVEVTVTGRPNNHINKIQEGEKVPAVARLDGQELPIEIDATAELYFETDDLREAM
jgi:hypothetical protein